MRLYYFISHGEKQLRKSHYEIYDFLHEMGVDIFSNVSCFQTGKMSRQELRDLEQTGDLLIGKMNGLIIEASNFSGEIGYFLALALGQKKRVLYLHEEGTRVNQMLSFILKEYSVGHLVSIVSYTRGNILKKIQDFVSHVEIPGKREKASIKFTLRITPRIDRYLFWKSRKLRVSKADFLRERILEELIENDGEYEVNGTENDEFSLVDQSNKE